MGLSLRKIGKSLEKGVKAVAKGGESLVSQAGKTLESGVREVGKGAENVVQETGKGIENVGQEIERNKGTIAGTLLAPVTGGASLAMASADDTSVGRSVEKAMEDVGHETEKGVNKAGHFIDDNKGTIAGLTVGALTGGLGTALLAGMAGKTMIDDPARADYQERVAEAKANAISREAAMMGKKSMLANELSMTARRAMAKRAAANLRKNTSTPASQFLGGEQQTLG